LAQQQQAAIGTDIATIKADINCACPSFATGTWVAVQFAIGGISTAISLDNRFNVGSYDSADLILRFWMKFPG
jgi:hypothetical protein